MEEAATLGIIGTGGLATFVVEGLRRAGDRRRILLSPRGAATAAALVAGFGCTVAGSNADVAAGAGILLLATPPGEGTAPLAGLPFRPDHLVLSAVMGLSLPVLAAAVAPAAAGRVMVSAAAAAGLDCVVLMPADPRGVALFGSLGPVTEVAGDADFEVVTALSTVHLWTFGLMEAIASAAIAEGLDPAAARRLVAGYVRAAGALALADTADAPLSARLDLHGKPGTMTRAGYDRLAADGVPSALARALATAVAVGRRRSLGDA